MTIAPQVSSFVGPNKLWCDTPDPVVRTTTHQMSLLYTRSSEAGTLMVAEAETVVEG